MSCFHLLLSVCTALILGVGAHAQAPAVVTPPAPVPAAAPNPNALVFDSDTKEYKAKPGDTEAPITFFATNVSSTDIQITALRPSCGCTAAQLPTMPYTLGAGSNVPIKVSMNLAGKMGLVTKSLGVESSVGFKSLILRVDIPQPTNVAPAPAIAHGAAPANSMGDRAKNIQIALNDRQAVFKGDCRSCHVDKGIGKVGKELYDADCGVCHDDVHRAAMVPDLKVPKTTRDLEFWRKWIAEGKPATMMPAFLQAHGGPLTQPEIDALASYLYQTLPKAPSATPAVQQALLPGARPPTAAPAPQKN
ncbi:MAG TPA: DUF1573 domain-containing protein [Candidatus Acidoferrum sp.]|nr:DUF1573 domain-containing protein [Candidatus Acidoferrum sp.]